jgi:ATP-binding cassette, subfamily B, bacterial
LRRLRPASIGGLLVPFGDQPPDRRFAHLAGGTKTGLDAIIVHAGRKAVPGDDLHWGRPIAAPARRERVTLERIRNFFRGAREIARSYVRIAQLVPVAGRGLVAVMLLVNLALGVLPVAFILATSLMIGRVPAAVTGGVGSAEWQSLVTWFVLAAAAFVAQQILAPLQGALGELMARRVDGKVYQRLIAASLRSSGIGPLEDQRLLDDLGQATRNLEFGFRTPGIACAALLALVARYTQLLGCTAVVGIVFSWPAAAALLLAVMIFRKGQRGGLRTYGSLFYSHIATLREGDYLRALAVRATAAKEIRVFGLAGWLSEKYRRLSLDLLELIWAERRRIYLVPFLRYTAFGLVVVAVTLAAVGQAAAAGSLTLTQLALALQAGLAALRLGDHYPEADTQTQFGMYAYDGVQDFERGMAGYDERTVALEPRRDPAGLPHREIRFESVNFRYPGTERTILDGLDLVVPAGKCTAIVGLNGAGKTTLVKLLGRLYDPSDGRLLVDGIDVRSFGVDDWRRQIGVIFQDFNRYELTAAENIGFGAIELAGNRERIREAARRAGMLATLERLPLGLDTPLARQYENGAELSGGQWQRVGIARALFALENGASILVLDEPTAALDVRAEAAFFDRFVDVTRGATAILISHRFSSVRHADHIVVLEHGRVIEQGSHEELVALGGRYADLFRLQAERFVDEDEDECEELDEVDLRTDEEDGAVSLGASAEAATAAGPNAAALADPEPAR